MKRGARFVLGFLLVATLASLTAMLLLYFAVGSEPDVAAHTTLVLRPGGDLPEVLHEIVFGGGEDLTIRAYVELIRKAKTDRRISGILLKPGGLDSPFWAKVQELREALDDFKRSGKFVHAWLEYAGDREYFLASVAESGCAPACMALERHHATFLFRPASRRRHSPRPGRRGPF